MLLRYAKSLELDEDALRAAARTLNPLSQAYPSYWARMALNGQRAAGAAACAVNFPAWGSMCARVHAALSRREEYGYGRDGDCCDDALDFIKFFGTPIENLDDMAAAVIDEVEGGVEYEDLVTAVRLLQEYEVMFWDAVYGAGKEGDN